MTAANGAGRVLAKAWSDGQGDEADGFMNDPTLIANTRSGDGDGDSKMVG